MGDVKEPGSRKTIPIDLRVKSHPVVLTTDIAERVVREASYIGLAGACQCRAERGCPDYPADFGCLYLGGGARGIVARGNAAEITVDQALEIVRQARELGLIHMILWTSGELRALGADAEKALELCSCCPCCCISRRTGDGMQAYIDGIAGLGIARAEEGCIQCGECLLACPLGALRLDDDGPVINADRCKGCGRCEIACKRGALKVYELEMVPSYDGGWEPIPAEEYLDQIRKRIA